jgi:hypothetical protein
MMIHPSLFKYAISFFAAHASPGNISHHTNIKELSKPRTIVPGSFKDAHTLGNRCAGESLVVWWVDGRE